MKKTKSFLLALLFFSSLILFPAGGEVRAAALQITADNDGLTLRYDIKRWGSDDVTLAPGDPEQQLVVKNIAGRFVELWLQVESVDTSQPIPVVNASIKMVFLGNPTQYPIAIPFGDYGLETNFFRRTRLQTLDAPIALSLALGPLKTDYDITLNFGPLFNLNYEGSSTLRNNVIHEHIILTGNSMEENGSIDLTILPVKTIPVTFFIYSGGVYDENNTLVQPFTGVLPFPNGTYQLWVNPGFDISSLASPQACCLAELLTCQDIPAAICLSSGGIPQGAETSCAEVDCSDNSAD